jgi:hypothetical protein
VKVFVFLLSAFVALVPCARSESVNYCTPVVIIPDGRVTQSYLSMTTTYWYVMSGVLGHSYSVEFEPPVDNSPSKVQFASLTVYLSSDSSTCSGMTPVGNIKDTSGNAPATLKGIYGAGRRLSFIAPANGMYLISIQNAGGAGDYTFRAIDTTLINLRWSTAGRYSDQWGFINLSDATITGTFTLYDLKNRPVGSMQFTIPSGTQAVRYSDSWDMNLPTDSSGYGVFSHNGPPGAVMADSYMISPNGTQVIYTKFEALVTH